MTTKWTVVQHSGVTTGHEEFAQGLQPRQVTTKRNQEAVVKAGGVLFDDYGEADRYCDVAMYPAGYSGLTPKAPGSFADLQIDGLRVYVHPQPEHHFDVTLTGCTQDEAVALMGHLFGTDAVPGPRTVAGVTHTADWGWRP